MDEPINIEIPNWRAERRRRFVNASAMFSAFISILLIIYYILKPREILRGTDILHTQDKLILFIALTFLAISATFILMIYLQTGFKKASTKEISSILFFSEIESLKKKVDEYTKSSELVQLSQELISLKNEMDKIKNSTFGIEDEQRLSILNDLKARVKEEATSSLLEDIEKKVADSYQQSTRDQDMEKHFKELGTRLYQEIGALGRRGNLNLALGIVTTVVGLVLLGYFVISSSAAPGAPKESWEQFIVHFIPRLTLVIFIETFAYFFLTLYKSSLSEIKYFQNELTNVEAQCIALRTAVTMSDGATIKGVINKISATERNFVLGKKQTTVELEKARIEKEGLAAIYKHIASLLPKK